MVARLANTCMLQCLCTCLQWCVCACNMYGAMSRRVRRVEGLERRTFPFSLTFLKENDPKTCREVTRTQERDRSWNVAFA